MAEIVAGVTHPGGPSSLIGPEGGGQEPPKQFWLNVNAELVLYGATEPGARVTICGWPIRLRPDGSFSCRFALPEGRYVLVVAAVSAQGEQRQADLEFSRHSQCHGEVGSQAQDPTLTPPAGEGLV